MVCVPYSRRLFPTERGIKAHEGIFIDPESVESTMWRLRNSAVVLDEMNRADLDKCIGELYPLLSHSAECVLPAGLPGVQSVTLSPKFRMLATVNDSRLDDIVFPISEGLARRFVRIELPGASEKEVIAFVSRDGTSGNNYRKAAASDAIEAFFDHVWDLDLLTPDEDDNRLPFDVAYFSVLPAWVDGRLLTTLTDETESERAKRLLVASLRPLGTARKWSNALRSFLSKG